MGDAGDPLSDERREELLERVRRRSSTVGTRIPESVTINGTELNLREFVLETRSQEVVPSEQREKVQDVRATLKRERTGLIDRLEHDPLTEEEATRLADTIVGIDRANAALTDLRPADTQPTEQERDVEKERSWVNFLDKILS